MTVPYYFAFLAAACLTVRALFGIAALTDKPTTEQGMTKAELAPAKPVRRPAQGSAPCSVAGWSAGSPGGGRDPRRTPVVAADVNSPRQPPAGVYDWAKEPVWDWGETA